MDVRKGNLIIKTWERCKSLGRGSKRSSRLVRTLTRPTKSWPRMEVGSSMEDQTERSRRNRQVAPEGCFSVYVGPEKQRFVVKTEYANHPLFRILLEEAEMEYGFNPEGPLVLPCKVEIFWKVLMAMEHDNNHDKIHQGCGFIAINHASYSLLSPSRMIALNQF